MFTVMKIAEMALAPFNMVLFLVLLALLALWLRRWRLGRRLLGAALALVLIIWLPPWTVWFLAPLENRFPAPDPLPDHVDGVVVLGGAIDPVLSVERGQPNLNGAAERVLAMAELARRFPDAKIVFSGGSGSISRQDIKEAPVVRAVMASLGIGGPRIVYEEQSRNTWENAVFSRAVAFPNAGETWLLVTSALHMPRSVGAFRAAGWRVVPYPVDYLTSPHDGDGWGGDFGTKAGALRTAMHEWGGLAYYHLRGWSENWYPAP